jgi:rhodanese/phosphatase family protein
MLSGKGQFGACLIVVSFALQATAACGDTARKLNPPGVPRFEEVTPHLFRGGQPTEEGFRSLARMGIGIVIDVRFSRKRERDLVTRLGMQYVPMHWFCPFPKDKVFARFLLLLRRNPTTKVFIHCRLGDDRTGMMIAAYRMAEQGWTAQQAWQEMKASGFAPWHHLICPGLAHYEKEFPERYRTKQAFQELRRPSK